MKSQIDQAVELLKVGEVVALPTETVYGLAADALNPKAVARIFAVKGRPHFDPLIVHVLDIDEAKKLTQAFTPTAEKLAKAFWPGPLTLVLPKKEIVPDIVTSGMPSVAVRVPSHPVMRRVLEKLGKPLAAPSANRFGRISPTCAQAVIEELGETVSMILDAGPSVIGVESTILSLLDEQPTLLRAGGLAVEDIEKEIGPIHMMNEAVEKPIAPGQLKSHYAPEKKVKLVSDWKEVEQMDCSKAGILVFGEVPAGAFGKVAQLSRAEDLVEAAANLFEQMRELDRARVDFIVAKLLPEVGLGRAINERLKRAAA